MRALLVLHAVVGIALVGALSHHAVWALRKKPEKYAQTRRYAVLSAILAAAQGGLGLWILPVWRPAAPLFQAKLWAAAAVLALAVVNLLLRNRGRAAVGVSAAALAWFVALAGLSLLGR